MATFSGGETLSAVTKIDNVSSSSGSTIVSTSASEYKRVFIVRVAATNDGVINMSYGSNSVEIVSFSSSGEVSFNTSISGTFTESRKAYMEVLLGPSCSLTWSSGGAPAGLDFAATVFTYNVP